MPRPSARLKHNLTPRAMRAWPVSGLWAVLLIALLPAAGTIIGAVLAEKTDPPDWVVGVSLHTAAGVAIGVVATALMPRALNLGDPLILTAAFLAGAAVSVLLAKIMRRLNSGGEKSMTASWMVFIAVAVDLLSDGLITGAGSAVASSLGLLLGISQVVGNLPGGYAVISNFRSKGVARKKRLLMTSLVPLPPIAGALAGYLVLRSTGGSLQAAALALIAGVLLLATVEDTVPEGDKPRPPRKWSSAAFGIGFAFMLALKFFESGGSA